MHVKNWSKIQSARGTKRFIIAKYNEEYGFLLATLFRLPWKQKTKDLQKDIFPIDHQILMKL